MPVSLLAASAACRSIARSKSSMKSFHRFILKIVSQYSGPPHNELMAAGTVGFWEAVERFNLNRNSGRLSTYAEHWIRKRVREAVKKWAKRARPEKHVEIAG